MKTNTFGSAKLFASTSGIAKRAMRLFAVLAAGCLTISAQSGSPSTPSAPSKKTQQQWLDSFSELPMSFEANQGQTDSQVEFVSRGTGYTLFLTKKRSGLRPECSVEPQSADERRLLDPPDHC